MITATIYNGRDNTLKLQLTSDDVAINHAALTRVQLKIGAVLLDSTVTPGLFIIASDSVEIKLGQAGLADGWHSGMLIAFDSQHTNGLVFGQYLITLVSI